MGGRAALLTPDAAGGFDLALKGDTFCVETEAISNQGDTTADASRVRLALEGSRAFETGGGSVLTPALEIGLRLLTFAFSRPHGTFSSTIRGR